MSKIEMRQTGSAMKNHTPHDGSGAIFWRAIRFCGEAMGDAAPPMLDARAIPRSSALVMSESPGRLRRIGLNSQQCYSLREPISYLDNGKTEDGRRNVADPHASEHSHEHVCE